MTNDVYPDQILGEVFLMIIHKICFHGRKRKIICGYPLLSGAMNMVMSSQIICFPAEIRKIFT